MNPMAVVTGGASGVGRAVLERLLDDGWSVAVIDADRDALGEAEDVFNGEEAVFLAADVTDEDEVAEAFDAAVNLFGPVSALVTCAGVRREAPIEQTSAEMFRELLEINLVGAFIAAQAALERMDDTLAIVHLSSAAGIRANAGAMAYGASKAGVKMMTEVMAVELAGRGVRVNCVAPGIVEDPTGAFDTDLERRRHWLAHTPQRRCVNPGEVAAAVVYLLSADAGSVNGHTLVVDGGFSVSGVPRGD